AAPAAALPGRVAVQLRGAPASLAAPFVRRLDEERRRERTAEARLVEPAAEQELVHRLQVAERERGSEQPERDGGAVHALAKGGERRLDDGAMTRGERGEVGGVEPFRPGVGGDHPFR